jgi:hypothetical protein
MTNTTYNIFSASTDDGSWIAVSIDQPRFCVGAPTKEEALAKADRAKKYFESVGPNFHRPSKETRVTNLFFEEEALYA